MIALSSQQHPSVPRDWKDSLARYGILVLYQAWADLRAESQRTYIGYLWWILDPIASMFVYYLVFDVIFDRGIENFAVFLFVGLIPWRWFQTALMTGANSILNARGIMLQVYLPKVVFPLVSFLTNTFKFLIVFVLLAVILALFGFPFGLPHLALPAVLLVTALFIIGCTLLAAAVTPFFPDIRMVLENVVRLWFFLSGIFYQISDMSPTLRFYFRLNPLAGLIESYRDILMFGRWPDLPYLAAVGVLGSLVVAAGAATIARYDYVYPRISP